MIAGVPLRRARAENARDHAVPGGRGVPGGREVRFAPDFTAASADNEYMTQSTATRTDFQIRAIDPAVLAELRQRDDSGCPPRLLVDAAGGSPLRCCLRRIRPGERGALVSYAPLRRWARETGADPGPYDETGPVFIHPEPCEGPPDDSYPVALGGSPRVLRAYSADGQILGGRLLNADQSGDAAAAAAVISEMLTETEVALVRARALEFGCFAFEARRV